MSAQYQQTFTTPDNHNNVTYIHFIHPSENQIIYCNKDEVIPTENQVLYCKDDEYYTEHDGVEETIEESYIDEDPMEGTVEILESVVVEPHAKSSSRRIVQIRGLYLMMVISRTLTKTHRAIHRYRQAERSQACYS